MRPGRTFFEIVLAYNAGYRDIILKGSARSGKTVDAITFLDITLGQSAKHRKASIVSQSFPHLRAGALYEYEKHFMREGYSWPHNKGSHEFSINKSTLDYFSLDKDGNKAIGPGRDILYINEPNRGVSFDNYTNLKTRTTECVIMDYNPSGIFWLHKQGILEDPRTKVIHSTWVENYHNLSENQIEDFLTAKRRSKKSAFWSWWWKVYGEGQDGIMVEERIMPFLKRASRVPDDAIEIPSGLDFGFYPHPTCFNRFWVRPNGTDIPDLYIKQIVYDRKLSINALGSTTNLTDVLLSRGVNKKHLIIADSEDPRSINDMRHAGFNIVGVSKSAVETSIRLFHEYNIIFVDGSEEGYNEFDNYRFKRDRKTNDVMPIPDDNQADHSIDNTRYVIMSEGLRWRMPKLNRAA